MAKKTQNEWDKKLEEVILELIKEFKINKNDEDDFAQEVRLYTFLNIDKAPHQSIFMYKIKKGIGIQKIINKFVNVDDIEYLEDNKSEEYSILPEVYRDDIKEILINSFPKSVEEYLKDHGDFAYSSVRARTVMRDKKIFLRYVLYDETYAEIARDYGLSLERVRGIVTKYMRRLKHPMYSKKLYAYTGYDLR